MKQGFLHSCPELIDYINEVGFLPLLSMGIIGWSADEAVDEDCRYRPAPDGGWELPLWEWKGSILQESECAYGKFIRRKAAFVSREWWPDFCNFRRSVYPYPEDGSVEACILDILKSNGSLTVKDLRVECGFTGPKMRSRFDSYLSRLEMGCYIVTEDFVYPRDRHGHKYGWGRALLTTPEILWGKLACHPNHTPEESRERIMAQLKKILPNVSDRTIGTLLV